MLRGQLTALGTGRGSVLLVTGPAGGGKTTLLSQAQVRLGPLDEAAVAQVAHDVLGGEPDKALRQVLTRADGQPFLVTELLSGLRDEHLVRVAAGTAMLAAGATMPRRFVGTVAGQLARLIGGLADEKAA